MPASSRATRPSTAGSHSVSSEFAYSGRKNRSTPLNTRGSCSCQPIPSPVTKAWASRSAVAAVATIVSKQPIRAAGLSSSASTAACSGGSRKVWFSGS